MSKDVHCGWCSDASSISVPRMEPQAQRPRFQSHKLQIPASIGLGRFSGASSLWALLSLYCSRSIAPVDMAEKASRLSACRAVLLIMGAIIATALLVDSARAQSALHPWAVVECDSRQGEGCFLVRDGLATDSDRGDRDRITLYDSAAECASGLSQRSAIKPRGGRWVWLRGKRTNGSTWQVWFECRQFDLEIKR